MRGASKILWFGAFSLVVTAVLGLLVGCPPQKDVTLNPNGDWDKENSHPSCGEASLQALTAGQHYDAGSVVISNDVNYLYVTYATTGGWVLTQAHVHVGFSDTDYPGYGSGNSAPIPGQFPYNTDDDPGFTGSVTEYTFVVPLTDLELMSWDCDISLYVFAHAAVSLLDDNGNVIQSETAWGGDTPGEHSNRWYLVAAYTLQCCGGEGEGGEEGAVEGAVEGEGAEEGAVEGAVEGEGAEEGAVEGAVEGEGAEEGAVEGAVEGEGAEEGEGAVEEGEVEGAVEGEGEGEEECGCEGSITELVLEYFRSCEAMVHIYPKNMLLGPLFEGKVKPHEQITLQGDILAPEIYIFVNYQVDSKIITDCSSQVGPGLLIGDFRVVSGKSGSLDLCPVIQEYECSACDGGVTELTFEYLGDVECIPLTVTQAGSIIPFFWGCVEPNAELTVNGPGIDGLFPPEISIWVGAQYAGNLDTSCETPIGAGCISVGPLLITGGKSLNGGYFCPCQ
ncbi:MAG TPA: hypothetical protein PLI09_18535 [Candidatus Hydrogenedentes bacterium]|nr:hypothetical protein [Candidatus Hydrogenedentota bacterium]